MSKKFYAFLAGSLIACAAFSQPAGWTYVQPLLVQNNTASLVTNYQLQFTFNTQTPIGAGQMLANGNDIRFGKDCAGTTLFNYWIESGINTAATVFWVKIDSLPASGTIQFYMFYGNASAPAASAILGTFIGPHSSTDSTANTSLSGSTNSQRGFRFSPTETVLATAFGKNEPTGATKYVTLFDFTTQAVLSQQQVAGPATQFSYSNIPTPLWLNQGQQYVLEIFNDAANPGYYFGAPPNSGTHITYLDMRYCNSCTQNTFPTNILGGMHYGYVDMWYFTKQTIATAPTVSPGSLGSGTLVTSTSGNTNVCPGDSALVSIVATGGTGTYSYSWLPTTGMANPNSASTMVLPPASGMYYCMVADACGNANYDSIYVTILTPPTVSASVSTDSVCIGGSFIATGSGAVSYSWTGGVTDGLPFTPGVTDNYTVTGTDASGCTNVAIATVTVMSLPIVDAAVTDSMVCMGDSVVFIGSGAQAYSWDNGVTDMMSYMPVSTMMYHVTGTDMYGCVNWDSIMVTVNSLPVLTTTSNGSPYCAGSGGSASMAVSGADLFTWNPGAMTGSVVTVFPNMTTTYTVTGLDTTTGCSNWDSVQIVVNPKPDLSATGGTECEGNCVQLNTNVAGGTPAFTYNWIPAAGLNSTTISNPIACVPSSTCYTVVITDANMCSDTTTVCAIIDPLPVVAATGPSTVCVTDGNYALNGTPAPGLFTGPGVSGTTFSPSSAGNGTHAIIYTYTDSSGCSASDTISIVVSPCVGIVDNNANDGVEVYPNPFGDELNLAINSTGSSHVRIFNSLGQIIFEQEMNAGRNTLSTAEMAPGVYVLEVDTIEGKTSIRIVKN